ncbi:putative disease resistance protein RGA1, partial [Dichanthelium oligosanthes]
MYGGAGARGSAGEVDEEEILILGVKGELRELLRTMNQIQCFLNDAEQRRTQESAVNNWLSELKDSIYEADDIIDMAKFEGNKLLANYPPSTSLLSRNSIGCTRSSLFSCIPTIQRHSGIAIRVRSFNSELEKIAKLGERFLKLQNMQAKEDVSALRKMKSCHMLEPNLVGKETSRASTRIVELVLAHKEKKTYKFSILGTGGVGKTTLAQKIYNDDKIKGTFSKQTWIFVSQEYCEVALLKEVLRSIGVHYDQDETVGELSGKLAMGIEKKSFFLVLDDIWQHGVWTNLLRIPLDTAATTVILLTTRNDTVAQAIGVEWWTMCIELNR